MKFLFLIPLLVMACSPDKSAPKSTAPTQTKTVKVENTRTAKKGAAVTVQKSASTTTESHSVFGTSEAEKAFGGTSPKGLSKGRLNSKTSAGKPSINKRIQPEKKAAQKANVGLADARYVIQFPTSKTGAETTVSVRPLGDYKMNLDYPASLNVDKTDAPAPLAGQQKSPSALTEAQLKFVMPIETTKASDKGTSIKAMIDFSVCNAQACEMVEKEITWKVKSGS